VAAFGIRSAIAWAWKPQKSVPIQAVAAPPERTAIIAARIARGRPRPLILFATAVTLTASLALHRNWPPLKLSADAIGCDLIRAVLGVARVSAVPVFPRKLFTFR